jgi:hypothetical protein
MPLALTAFFDLLPIGQFAFSLPEPKRRTRTRGGIALEAFDGVPIWRGRIGLAPNENSDSVAIEALLRSLKADGTFYAYDWRRPCPKLDPTGSIIGANAVKIQSVGGDNTSIALNTLTNGYGLSVGDLISIARSNGKPMLVQAMAAITANGSGVTSAFQVWPPLRSGISAGAAVSLIKPPILAKLAGGWSPSAADGPNSEGIGFAFEEDLR